MDYTPGDDLGLPRPCASYELEVGTAELDRPLLWLGKQHAARPPSGIVHQQL